MVHFGWLPVCRMGSSTVIFRGIRRPLPLPLAGLIVPTQLMVALIVTSFLVALVAGGLVRWKGSHVGFRAVDGGAAEPRIPASGAAIETQLPGPLNFDHENV